MKKTYERPTLMKAGLFSKDTGLIFRGVPDLLSHGNIL